LGRLFLFPGLPLAFGMKTSYPDPVFPGKPQPPHVPVPVQGGSSAGRFFGCAAIGCGSLVLLLVAFCGIGYWFTFYSSTPLNWIASGIEESGNAKIEGLKGNLTTGVEVEQFQFRESPADANWSQINGLRVKYRFTGPFWNKNGIVIDEVSIVSARLYVDLDGEVRFSSDLDLAALYREVRDEIRDEAAGGDVDFGGANFEVKQVLLQSIVLVDRDTGRELKLDELRFDGLKIAKGELVELGNVVLRADLAEIESLPGEAYASTPINRLFRVRLKKEMTDELAADLPLDIDFGYDRVSGPRFDLSVCDGQIRLEPSSDSQPWRLVFDGFQPATFFSAEVTGIMPEDLRLVAERSRKDDHWILGEGEHGFRLGQTGFQFDRDDQPSGEQDGLRFVAVGEVDGSQVRATLTSTGRLPFVMVELQSDGFNGTEEIWARTVFGRAFGELAEEQKAAVLRTIRRLQPETGNSADQPRDQPGGSDKPEEPEEPGGSEASEGSDQSSRPAA
jgi:hypothetical protein